MLKNIVLVPLLIIASSAFANDKALSPALTLRCAPCHGPDLNGVGGVFPSLMTSQLVKSGNLDGVIKFITHGSPADSQSLVKMPAKGGHLDLGDEEIRDIAKQVIELARNYIEKKAPATSSKEGYFKERFGPVVSTAIETAPVVSWPPAETAPERAKETLSTGKEIIGTASRSGGQGV
jgi:hypothetical protein